MRRKVSVNELAIGMYVAELDKPWEQSSFLFQGFVIETPEDLKQLREECRHVFVDVAPPRDAHTPNAARRPMAPSASTVITSRSAPEAVAFRNEVREVAKTQQAAGTTITRVMDDFRMGKSLDTAGTKTAVTQMVGAISHNPNSMLWLTNLREKHQRTASHCLNTAILAIAFGKHIGLNEADLNILGQGAMLHDIGMARIATAIVDKPGKLTEEEWQAVHKHPADGEAVLKITRKLPEKVLEIVRMHHEHLDGKGYPDGIAGDSIPLAALITGLVDAYDSLTTDSPYRAAVSPADALRILRLESAHMYGRELVQEFIRCLGIYPVGSLVRCNNGALAVIMSSNAESRLKPLIMVVRDENGADIKPRLLLNLATMGEDLALRYGIAGNADPKAYKLNLPGIIAEEAGL